MAEREIVRFLSDSFKISKCLTLNKKKLLDKTDQKFLTIIGTAKCVITDIKKFGIHGDVSVVNDAGFYVKEYYHLVSVHGDMIEYVKEYRKKFRFNDRQDFLTHSLTGLLSGRPQPEQEKVESLWMIDPLPHSSGSLAIAIGIAMGYKAILVHGIPLESMPHFFDLGSMSGVGYDRFFTDLSLTGMDEVFLKSNIRVSSGKLSEFIGKPTKEWIHDNTR